MSKVRISIGNLATFVGHHDSKGMLNMGIWNPNKDRHVKALGGAVQLNEQGVQVLKEAFGASDFESDHEIVDARFVVDEARVEAVLDFFSNLSVCEQYERDRSADFMAELKELEMLSEELLPTVEHELVVVQRQAKAIGADTSDRAKMPTIRLFRKFVIRMSQVAICQIFNSKHFRLMSDSELETTQGGACAGFTQDGAVIQNNLFL